MKNVYHSFYHSKSYCHSWYITIIGRKLIELADHIQDVINRQNINFKYLGTFICLEEYMIKMKLERN